MADLSKRRFISEYDFALANSGWNHDATIRWLEKAYEGRVGLLVYAGVDSVWDGLRGQARFQDLLRRIGVAP
jgi:hypothetical protein